ncbi:MAG: hypothetical protein HY665_00645 [Chloroflexi bacterium]|nr:hypothetical protein [Chloroflexota bacterium]
MQEQCCPRLRAEDWDKKELVWNSKPFYRTKYRSLLHMPLNIGGVTTRAMGQIRTIGLTEEPTIMLSKEESMFGSTLLLSVKQESQDIPTAKLSGKYVTRLFEGNYRYVGKWANEMKRYLVEIKKEPKEMLFWYVTCPKCAKKYGSAQTVILAAVE